jgi:hypothetical protein
MKYLILVSLIFLVGCQTTVEREFPSIPPSLSFPCEDLDLISEDTDKMSEMLVVITNNYNSYHRCQAKVDAWLMWHKEQKEIFESVY